MQMAFSEAQKAAQEDEIPIAALIIDPKTNKIISKAHNQRNSLAHAEILAINLACQELSLNRLDGYDIFVTVEPCTMCAAAISLARIKNLYFGSPEKKFGSIISNVNYFESPACHHKVNYYHGFMEEEIKNLMQDFFKKKR